MWTAEVELRLVTDALRAYVDEHALAMPGHLTLAFESEEAGQQILAEQMPPPEDSPS
jgi:hypothetical protein